MPKPFKVRLSKISIKATVLYTIHWVSYKYVPGYFGEINREKNSIFVIKKYKSLYLTCYLQAKSLNNCQTGLSKTWPLNSCVCTQSSQVCRVRYIKNLMTINVENLSNVY